MADDNTDASQEEFPETPDIATPEEREKLIEVARWIEGYRKENKVAKSEFCRRYRGLGNDSTFGKILLGKLNDLKVSKWLGLYLGVKATLEIIRGKGKRKETIYHDLSMAVKMEDAYMDVSAEASVARFAIGLAPSGCGKSSAMRALVNRYSSGIKVVEASVSWADRPARMLGELMQTFGDEQPPTQHYLVSELVVKTLRQQSEICVVIDEAHHMGPECLNTIKTLINKTHASFIALSLPTLWARLTRSSYEDVIQLTGNRLKTRFDGVLELGDVRLLLSRGVVWENGEGDVAEAAPLLTAKCAGRGNLAFTRAVVDAINQRTEGKAATLKDYAAAVAEKEAAR